MMGQGRALQSPDRGEHAGHTGRQKSTELGKEEKQDRGQAGRGSRWGQGTGSAPGRKKGGPDSRAEGRAASSGNRLLDLLLCLAYRPLPQVSSMVRTSALM